MKRTTIALLALLAAHPAAAARPRASRPSAGEELTIRFTAADAQTSIQSMGGSDAQMSLGTVTSQPGRRGRSGIASRSIVTTRRVAIRIDSSTGTSRLARLQASIATLSGQTVVRIDGKRIGPIPQLIDPLTPIGVAVAHVIEVEVPASQPEGALLSNIIWTAETN